MLSCQRVMGDVHEHAPETSPSSIDSNSGLAQEKLRLHSGLTDDLIAHSLTYFTLALRTVTFAL